jgi:hypothetical protein
LSSFTLFASVIKKVYILILCSCKFVRVSFIIHDNSQIATVFIVRWVTQVFYYSFFFICILVPLPFPLIL